MNHESVSMFNTPTYQLKIQKIVANLIIMEKLENMPPRMKKITGGCSDDDATPRTPRHVE